MRMILGLDAPTQGSVTVGGRSYRDLPAPMREVGRLAAAHGIVLSELTPVKASLEQAFMGLTRESVEYQAAGVTR